MQKLLLVLFFLGIVLIGYGFLLKKNETQSSTIVVTSVPTTVGVSPTPSEVLSDRKEPIETTPESSNTIHKETTIQAVYDGDTLETESGEKIRLLGINTPETGQPYSAQSTQATKEMVLGRVIGLEYDAQTLDRYGRTLAYVYTGKTMVNLEILKRGLAVVETIAPNVKYQDSFIAAQKLARDSCKGMWEGLCMNGVLSIAASCIQISSIKADATGDDNQNKNGEWVELKILAQKIFLFLAGS